MDKEEEALVDAVSYGGWVVFSWTCAAAIKTESENRAKIRNGSVLMLYDVHCSWLRENSLDNIVVPLELRKLPRLANPSGICDRVRGGEMSRLRAFLLRALTLGDGTCRQLVRSTAGDVRIGGGGALRQARRR